MGLREQLTDDLKQAMRAKDQLRMDTIRSVRAAVINREVEKGAELDDDAVVAILRTLVKQRDDAIEQYREGDRQDLADAESREKQILSAYLPAAPDAADVEAAVTAVVAELGASSMKDMGRVMKECKERLGAAVDGKTLSSSVKAKLS